MFSFNKRSISCLALFLLLFLLFYATYALFGFYYGWLDDVIMINHLRGTFYGQPTDALFVITHVFLSKIYLALYRLNSGFWWYDLFMYCYLFLACFNIFLFLYKIAATKLNSIAFFLFFLVFIYFAALFETVYLITFTTVAILLFGSSLLNIIHIVEKKSISNNRLAVGYFVVLLIIGFLTRPEVCLLLIPSFLIYVLVSGRSFGLVKRYGLIAALCFLMAANFLVRPFSYTDDSTDLKEYHSHLINLLDGFNGKDIDEFKDPKERIKALAIYLWFSGDREKLISKDFLNKLGPASPFSWSTFKHWKHNLKMELNKAKNAYGDDYLQPRNWFWKSIIIIAVNFVLVLLNLFVAIKQRLGKKYFLRLLLPYLGFLVTLCLIIITVKMEDRVLYPSLLIITLLNVYVMLQLPLQWNRIFNIKFKTVGLIVMIALCVFRINGYSAVVKDYEHELMLKDELIKEINSTFRDKIIFFDIFSMTLIHGKPFSKYEMNASNKYTCYGEVWSNFMAPHQQYLKTICSTLAFKSFLQCLYNKGDKVIFIFEENRIGLYEDYMRIVYGVPLKFEKISSETSAISKIHHTFMPNYFNFGYYQLKEGF